jgi:hypothetical protein
VCACGGAVEVRCVVLLRLLPILLMLMWSSSSVCAWVVHAATLHRFLQLLLMLQ